MTATPTGESSPAEGARHAASGLIARVRKSVRDYAKNQLAAPARPPRPGEHLEAGFRRRWLWFFLPVTFVFFWVLWFGQGLGHELDLQIVGFDSHIYYHGSAAWLAGQNPWATGAVLGDHYFSYAGLPPTVILLAPLTLLPEEGFLWLWLVASCVAAVVVVRSLRLPIVWFTYPPLFFGVMSANPNVVLLAFLLAGGALGGAVASSIKVIAIPPLFGERRWRDLAVVAAVMTATVLLFPGLWASFLSQATRVQDTINGQSNGGFSAWGRPYLLIPTIGALVILARIDLRAAAWLVVPAIFPTSQYHYAIFALPVDPFLAASMAFPIPAIAPIAVIFYTVIRVGIDLRRRSGLERAASPDTVGQPAGT